MTTPRTRFARATTILAAALLASGCEMPLALEPRGPAAAEIAGVWWILFWIAVVVSLIVFVLLFVAIGRGRETDRAAWLQGRENGFVFLAGVVVPAVILTGTTILTLGSLRAFDHPPEVDLAVTVRGHMFWWEVVYPGFAVVTANEVHIPVGEPVRVELESADVIHSFWVPQLNGKLEMVPGQTNVLYLQADAPGTYFGKCAEFCGRQHANMEFLVIAQERPEFEAWLEQQAEDAPEPQTELAAHGREVFVNSPCALCHTIRGVSRAAADVGPDLTHLGTRRTLAARTLDNTIGNLGGWILDPQGIKHGSRMPAVNLPSGDFIALLEYLTGLR